MYTFGQIFEYLLAMGNVFLSFLGIEVDEETKDNIKSMFEGLFGYEPQN